MVPDTTMTRRFRRPTLLAVCSEPGDETIALSGTLAVYAWRGVRTVLVVLSGADDARLRTAVTRSVFLLGIENHFHWQAGKQNALRLARILRSFQPGGVITDQATRSISEQAWALASDKTLPMPGLAFFDSNQSRLWETQLSIAPSIQHREGIDEGEEKLVSIDISATRALLRVLPLHYHNTVRESDLLTGWDQKDRPHFVEPFKLLLGHRPTGLPSIELFSELSPSPSHPSISFLT